MSERRSISFNDDELDLLKYFENNGRSKIVKIALRFYINNKDNVINDATLNILKAININLNTNPMNIPCSNNTNNPNTQNNNLNSLNSNNISKLKK